MSNAAVDRAEAFLQSSGRLLERRLFEQRFRDGSANAVRAVLLGYRNEDGGFGNALEPDVRARHSTALHCEVALYALRDAAIVDAEIADGIAGFLASIAEEDGRVPIIRPEVLEAPHAQHWDFGLFPAPSPNPTASLAGMLAGHGSQHPWVERATAWTWERLEKPVEAGHELIAAATFLAETPDRERSALVADRVMASARTAQGVVLGVGDESYGVTPLQIFPRPDLPGVDAFERTLYDAFLDELAGRQQADGGWPIAFEPVNAACAAEWRGRFTLEALQLLGAWGRL